MKELNLYRPANGTEGSMFEARFCDHCVYDVDQACEIHTSALVFDTTESEYPREWTYDAEGEPVCTKFATALPPPTLAELERVGQRILSLNAKESTA